MKAGLVGGIMLGLLLVALAVLPLVLEVSPNQQSLRAAFAPPGPDYVLGADQYGRSLLARLVEGGRISVGLSISVVFLCTLTGVLLSSLAVWSGGAWDVFVTTLADSVYAMPGLLLVLVVAGLFGGSLTVLVAALWLASWPEYYRLSRSVIRRIAASDHVLASRTMGVRLPLILWYQLLPPVMPYVVGIGCLALGRTILAIAALGFLGIGIAAPQAEWGSMLGEYLPYVERIPMQVISTIAAMAWTVTACLLVGQDLAGRIGEADGRDD